MADKAAPSFARKIIASGRNHDPPRVILNDEMVVEIAYVQFRPFRNANLGAHRGILVLLPEADVQFDLEKAVVGSGPQSDQAIPVLGDDQQLLL